MPRIVVSALFIVNQTYTKCRIVLKYYFRDFRLVIACDSSLRRLIIKQTRFFKHLRQLC